MKKKDFLTIIVVSAVSAIIALLFAPKTGKKMREDLKDKALDTKKTVKEGSENLVEDFKDSYFEAVDEVEKELDVLSDRQRDLRETISSIESELTN